MSRDLNLDDRTKNAGGNGHRRLGALCGKCFAYEVMILLFTNLQRTFYRNMFQHSATPGSRLGAKYWLPKTEA